MADVKKLGRYELRRVLGKGAMGVVYEGYDPTLSRRVAVKTILSSVAHDVETERNYAERFVREAKAAARLNHAHIVQVHDFGVENDVAYLVMEFIQGRELRDLFTAGERFEPGECVRIMGELLDALEFAHEAGVVHRDVKPANVMLDAQRRVKLADFGVARVQESERSAAGTMVGTPAFMSPEQIQGGKIDRRTDIFSAGTILYQLLTGEQPFKGEGSWTVVKQIMQDDPPAPSLVVRSISPAFDVIVDKALAKKVANRFASAAEFAAALRGTLGAAPHAGPAVAPAAKPRAMPKASETELEFWRAIQNSSDAHEFEFYLEKFPDGTYAQLARHKIGRLKEPAASARTIPPAADDATIAIPEARPAHRTADLPPPAQAKSFAIPAAIAAVVIGGAIAAYLFAGRAPAPAPIATPAKPEAAPAPAVDADKIRRETEDRMRKEFSEKAAAERAALEKAVVEKLAAERAATERVSQARTAAERAAAEKAAAAAAAERIAAEKVAASKASERAAAERAAADKASAEKAAAERLAAEKAAADKAAADKAAAEKLATEKAASNSVEAQLERFIQRKGRDRVLKQEPLSSTNYSDPIGPGEVVYVNDGACPPGRIREVTGTPINMGSNFRSRPSRCISLVD